MYSFTHHLIWRKKSEKNLWNCFEKKILQNLKKIADIFEKNVEKNSGKFWKKSEKNLLNKSQNKSENQKKSDWVLYLIEILVYLYKKPNNWNSCILSKVLSSSFYSWLLHPMTSALPKSRGKNIFEKKYKKISLKKI